MMAWLASNSIAATKMCRRHPFFGPTTAGACTKYTMTIHGYTQWLHATCFVGGADQTSRSSLEQAIRGARKQHSFGPVTPTVASGGCDLPSWLDNALQ